MRMKYCVAFNVGGNQGHERYRTLGDVRSELRRAHEAMGFATVTTREGEVVQADTADIYPVCDDCHNGATYHDYPIRRYQIGPRGGVVDVII